MRTLSSRKTGFPSVRPMRRRLREGKVLFVRDEDRLYEVAVRTARAFEGFRHHYRNYLDAVERD